MNLDEIIDRCVKNVSREHGIPEGEIWRTLARFMLRRNRVL
ncbi:MAG: hypothetical protein QXQ38_05870 [Archaeoglobaceae archaeon]